MNRVSIYLSVLLLIMSILSSGCGIYTFSGASIPEGADSFWVELFDNRASLVNPQLALTLTEDLQDRVVNETGLDLKKADPDLTFRGSVVRYETRPLANAGTDVAPLNELRIAIEVTYTNTLTAETWTQQFVQTATFDQGTNLAAVEDALNEEITDLLIQEIFNKAFVNW